RRPLDLRQCGNWGDDSLSHGCARRNPPTGARAGPQEARSAMPDPRWETLAETLVQHSTRLAGGGTLLIECFDLEDGTLPRLLVRKAARRGAYPLVETKSNRLVRELLKHASEPQLRAIGAFELRRMESVQAYIGLRGASNINELSDVPADKLDLYNAHV